MIAVVSLIIFCSGPIMRYLTYSMLHVPPNNEIPYVLDAAFTTADRAVIASVCYRTFFIWPNNEIPYVIDAAIITADRAVIAAVCF
jgi:hypothetical protein